MVGQLYYLLWLVLLGCCSLPLWAEVSVVDGTGRNVHLSKPASRVVSLAPHLTEHLFSIGVGGKVVGAVDFSDYPEAAKRIMRVGGYSGLDMEAIRALKPDLIVAWQSGNPGSQLVQLQKLGVPVFLDDAKVLKDIPVVMEKLGVLMGASTTANQQASRFRLRLAQLSAQYQAAKKVRVFYQVWQKPLMTINREQIISDAMRVCGGVNVFASAASLVPTVDEEAVIAAKPELIATSGDGAGDGLAMWQKWRVIPAVANGHLRVLPKDVLSRLGPRMLDGTEALCKAIAEVRR